MTRITWRRAIAVALLLLWTVSSLVIGESSQRLAEETGLDADLVRQMTLDVGGSELTITFVFINERTFQSKISPRLSALLQPYVGQNAVYVNPSVESVVDWFPFDPRSMTLEQSGTSVPLPAEVWDELTPGFLAGRFEVNPSGPDQGSGSEGVVVLGDALDRDASFDLVYGDQRVTFELGASTASTAMGMATTLESHDPIEVAPLQTLGVLQDVLLHEDFSSESMAALFGLDPALVRTLVLSPRGSELRLFFVRLEEQVRDSLFGPDLLTAIEDLIGTGAVMVWAISPTGAEFTAWNFYIRQGGSNYVFFSKASFVELTEDFVRVERVEPGEVVAGVIRLPASVDAEAAWSVYYGTAGAEYP